MKKYISVFLILSVILSAFSFMPASYAYDENVKFVIFTDEYMNLTKTQGDSLPEILGIIPKGTNKDVVLTRGKAAFYLARLCRILVVDEKSSFKDVPDEHVYKNEINGCVASGIIDCSGQYYRPNEAMTANEIIDIFAKVLGYKEVGGVDGAVKARLMSGTSFPGGVITEKAFATITENALKENCIEAYYSSNKVSYEAGSTTLLYSMLKIKELKGKIRAIGTNALSGYDARTGYINLDGKMIRSDISVDISLLSREVKAYVTEENEQLVLKGISLIKNNTNCVRLHHTELNPDSSAYTKRQVSAYVNNKLQNYAISQNATVIYNGRVVEEYEKADICPTYGEMLLIDDNFDNVYETVMVYNFDVKIVKFIYWYSQRVSCYDETSYGGEVDRESNLTYVCYRNGVPCELKDFNVEDTISVAMPRNREEAVCYVFGTDSKVEGTVSLIKDDVAVINGVSYNITKNAQGIKVGTSGTFCIDIYGGISLLPGARPDNYIYGYVLSKAPGKTFESGKVKMFAETGEMNIYETAAKVKLDDAVLPDAEFIEKLPINTLIKYRTNSEGKLTQVYTPSTETTNIQPYNTSKFSLDYKKTSRFVSNTQQALGGYYLGDGNTVLMRIPTFADAIDEDYYIMDTSNIIGGYQYEFEVYESDERFKPDVVLVKMGWKYGRSLREWDKNLPVIVSEVRVTLRNDEPCYEIDVFSKQNHDTLYADRNLTMKWDEVFKATYGNTYPCPNGNNVFTPMDLKPGDIIHIEEPEGRELTNVRMLYRNDLSNPVTNPGFCEYIYTGNKNIIPDDSTWHYLSMTMIGKIHYIGDTYVVVKTGDGRYRTMAKTLTGKLSFPGVVYLKGNDTLRLAKPADWRVGADVVIHANLCALDAIIIME